MRKFIPLLTFLFFMTILFGTIAVVAQQLQRANAYDPQIQIAEDAAIALNNEVSPQGLVGVKVDLQKSLAPFIIIYDKLGVPVAGNGFIGKEIPVIPFGVLNASKNKSYHTVTWQPQSDVRLASVTVKANNFYVVTGKSLRETEKRESQIMLVVAVGWIFSVAGILIATYFYVYRWLLFKEWLAENR